MGFFEHYFGISSAETEVAVCCPFPHVTSNGVEYYETNPSASVNTKSRMFHCMACSKGFSELTMISKLLDCTYANAVRLSKAFSNSEDCVEDWDKLTYLSDPGKRMCKEFGITDEVIKELHIASNNTTSITFPVFMYDKLIDERTYTPGGAPKMRSRAGAPTGLIVPFDVLESTPKNQMVYICAGEKDMAVSRSNGINAYTLTGGEQALPISPVVFKDRHICILYDNDEAGKLGANKLASYLLPYAASVRVCTEFHKICAEDKEDMTDYWNKYHGTKEQLVQMVKDTPLFTETNVVQTVANIPTVTLAQATTSEYLNKIVQSNIQVVAVSDVQFVTPKAVVAEKLQQDDGVMNAGEVREWYLTEENVQDILHLMDGGFKEDDITKNLRRLMHILDKEKWVRVTKLQKDIVYKGTVTDMFESINTNELPMEYTAYSIGVRLESGKKYNCKYKIVPHPYKGQQLVMIIIDATPANDSVSTFKLTDENKALLDEFKNIEGTVPERIDKLTQKVKGLLGYNGNDLLIKVIDLSFHTVLAFNFGQFKNVRGYLDTLVVGESRVGKSSTADALRRTYQLGAFTSLAGNSATIPGLIGGSSKTPSGHMQTKAGLIPQNHKGLIIFEEFGKCNSSIITELTDIRSSNEVRITRVSGTLTLPAMVRMIALSNVKSNGSEIKSIASYPNGLAIVTELVPTAEDIARYDILCVLGDRGNAQIDPFWQPETPLSDKAYQARIRWVWSRRPEQIVIPDDVARNIVDCANALNHTYDCHIKVFGTEAWKKLSRLAIAIAGYLVSTDETYQNIVVTKEHVQYAVNLFEELYDNPTFRLREYVLNERKYNDIDADGVELLQQLYIKIPQMLLILEQESSPSRNTVLAAAGVDANTYNGFMSQLIKGYFVRLNGSDILPTERFRKGMKQINRNASVQRLGEEPDGLPFT